LKDAVTEAAPAGAARANVAMSAPKSALPNCLT
jgi:hypothetical protein